jgi:hypothetical protein
MTDEIREELEQRLRAIESKLHGLPWGQYEAEWREVDDIRQKIAELAAKPSRMNWSRVRSFTQRNPPGQLGGFFTCRRERNDRRRLDIPNRAGSSRRHPPPQLPPLTFSAPRGGAIFCCANLRSSQHQQRPAGATRRFADHPRKFKRLLKRGDHNPSLVGCPGDACAGKRQTQVAPPQKCGGAFCAATFGRKGQGHPWPALRRAWGPTHGHTPGQLGGLFCSRLRTNCGVRWR